MLLTYSINETIFIHFDKLVKKGVVILSNSQHKPVSSQSFNNTNFVKLSNNELKGTVHLEIDFDGEHVLKTLEIIKKRTPSINRNY